MFSVVNVNKPSGMTSHDVVSRLRKVYNLRKVGHLGTLDPAAEGVLPVCLGQATRLIEYFPTNKAYRAEITFGITTDTLDREGEVQQQVPCPHIDRARVEAALPAFLGTIEQRVPAYSAVHVGGRKLYEYARAGQAVAVPTKTVRIDEVALVAFTADDYPRAVIDVACEGGTYVRAIARDLGEALGCGAHLSHLVRTAHGRFRVEEAVPLAEIESTLSPAQYLQNPALFLDLPFVDIASDETMAALCHGMTVSPDLPLGLKGNALCLVRFMQEPVAVARFEAKRLKPVKVFKSPAEG